MILSYFEIVPSCVKCCISVPPIVRFPALYLCSPVTCCVTSCHVSGFYSWVVLFAPSGCGFVFSFCVFLCILGICTFVTQLVLNKALFSILTVSLVFFIWVLTFFTPNCKNIWKNLQTKPSQDISSHPHVENTEKQTDIWSQGQNINRVELAVSPHIQSLC